MPSDTPPAVLPDPTLAAALAAVTPAFSAWRSAVAAAAEEARATLDRSGADSPVAATLGAFAVGRIHLERFAGLVERGDALPTAALDALRDAARVLAAAVAPGAAPVVVRVPDGSRMRDVVGAAYARLGGAFAAARFVALAPQGRLRHDGPPPSTLEPRAWNKRERRVAPPLVVEVAGADLDAASLVEVLDGGAKVVLLVRGPAAPAPLVRLVTPGTFVLQTPGSPRLDAAGLAAFSKAAGPAVAAVLPEDAAAFVHDPALGRSLGDRLVVRNLPPAGPRNAVGPWSSAQQDQEIRQLEALAERAPVGAEASRDARDEPVAAARGPAAPVAATAEGASAAAEKPAAGRAEDPAGRLAAWLLGQIEVGDLR